MIIPVPNDWKQAEDMIKAGKKFIKAMELMSKADAVIRNKGFDTLM